MADQNNESGGANRSNGANENEGDIAENLLELTKQGDQDSLADLLFHLTPQLRSYCETLISKKWQSLISADDILQESFTEIFISSDAFRGSTVPEFVGWAKRICKNNYLDADKGLSARKRGGGMVRSLTKEDSMMNLFEVVCDDDSPRLSLAKQESLKRLAESIRQLSPDYATVILAYDIEGKSAAEIADNLNVSEGAIYMRRTRALRELKNYLGSSIEF